MENWKTVITFTLPHEAHIAAGVLESEGIETMIKDEFTAQVNNFYSNAIGGVKIQIKENDFTQALSFLQKGGFIKNADADKTKKVEMVERDAGANENICPFCKSDNIGQKKQVRLIAVFIYFILGALFPIFKRSYKCYSCNKEWKYVKSGHFPTQNSKFRLYHHPNK